METDSLTFYDTPSDIVYNLPHYVYESCLNHRQEKLVYENGNVNHRYTLCRSGYGIIETNNTCILLEPGQIFFVKKGVPCAYIPISKDWRVCYATFNGELIDYSLELDGVGLAHAFDDEFLTDLLLDVCISAENGMEPYELGIKMCNTVVEFNASTGDFLYPKPYVRALRYIEAHYDENGLTVPYIVAASGIPSVPLSDMFKQYTNMTIGQYLISFRMKMACELLTTTRKHINDIARYVGYDAPNNFAVAFKKAFGVTPKEYRNAYVEKRIRENPKYLDEQFESDTLDFFEFLEEEYYRTDIFEHIDSIEEIRMKRKNEADFAQSFDETMRGEGLPATINAGPDVNNKLSIYKEDGDTLRAIYEKNYFRIITMPNYLDSWYPYPHSEDSPKANVKRIIKEHKKKKEV